MINLPETWLVEWAAGHGTASGKARQDKIIV